ncbi:MAG: hypothetical protein ACTSQO_00040 [Candidatus Helarchaeota archaeon]
MAEKESYEKKLPMFFGNKITALLFLINTLLLLFQATTTVLGAFGIIPYGNLPAILSGSPDLVNAIYGFFLQTVILTISFAGVSFICFVGIYQQQEWAAGISLILTGLISINMVVHLIFSYNLFGFFNTLLEFTIFALSTIACGYIIKNFKKYT